jgi:outer membrane lipoprotein LolB
VDAAWRIHRARLAEVTGWHLRASLAVRAGEEGGQAIMEWRQRDERFDIRLSGPLGSGAVRLTGDRRGARLRLANGEDRDDSDAARLLYDATGWWLPVESLRYWAVGLADPAQPATWDLDEYGRLATLTQDGWEVRFEAYAPAGTLELPARVTVTGRDAEVRLIARRWTVDLAEVR